ncbi:MAG TPA: DUF58 domain-containing protein [Propionibacteriaceae bacterium]|nr:DUF58 domain-containing protein [Propionibacteriaceae bacterium]
MRRNRAREQVPEGDGAIRRTPGLTADRLLRQLEWRIVRRLDGRSSGDYRTVYRGTGLDVADLREYMPGDDLRHIDWNVTARMDAPYVREFLEDRELTAWLLLDTTASMGFGPLARHKGHVLTELATTIAYVLVRGGNRVGAMLFGGPGTTGVTIPPGSGRRHVLRIAKALIEGPTKGTGAPTDLSVLLRSAAGVARRRGLVVVISDFLSEPGWDTHLGMLAQRHEVVCLRVTDPREYVLPAAGLMWVEDAETGEQLFVDTDDPGFRHRLAEGAAARREELGRIVARAGAELHDVSTEDDLVRVLGRIAALRSRRAGGRVASMGGPR